MTNSQGASLQLANPDAMENESAAEITRIGDMAKTFEVSLRTLRFYEDKGLLSPKREGTTRLYSRRDRARMKLIMLGRKVGFSLRDVKQIMDLYDPAGSNSRQMRLALEKSEKQMGRLQVQQQQLEEAVQELGELINFIRGKLAAGSEATRKSG